MPAKGQKRKNQIIDAAKAMFIERGYQSTHIGQICDELNIARGTVYQYFGNKREIVYSILEGVEDELDDIFDNESLEEFASSNPEKTAIFEFISSRYTSCVKAVLDEPIIIMLMYKEISGLDDDVIERTERFVDHVTRIISRDLEALKARGYYRADIDPQLTALLILGSVQLLMHEFHKRRKDLLDRNVIKGVVDLITKGIMA